MLVRQPIINPRMFALDLDGTLLNSEKFLTEGVLNALEEISKNDIRIAFASGRIESSMKRYVQLCSFPVSLLSLNGAVVCMDAQHGSRRVYGAALPAEYADFLLNHAEKQGIAANYYIDNNLYSIRTEKNKPWLDLYYQQTQSYYNYIPSFNGFRGRSPDKIIFIGPSELLDEQQKHFVNLWGESVYICRTWDFYLEFLNPLANKGDGMAALASSYGIAAEDVVAFGDASNDVPMLRMAGLGIAVRNASADAKLAAKYVSSWSNDEDAVAREWGVMSSRVVG